MKETLYNLIQSQGEGAVTITDVAINLIAALLIGALIYIAYRATHSGTVYSERFNISLVSGSRNLLRCFRLSDRTDGIGCDLFIPDLIWICQKYRPYPGHCPWWGRSFG